jgi:hypothetical protein
MMAGGALGNKLLDLWARDLGFETGWVQFPLPCDYEEYYTLSCFKAYIKALHLFYQPLGIAGFTSQVPTLQKWSLHHWRMGG